MERSFTRTTVMLLVAGLGASAHAQAQAGDSDLGGPQTLQLTGTVRDFQSNHPDFQRRPTAGFGHYVYMVADQLDEEGKPAFGSTGYKLTRDFKDGQGRKIMAPRDHLPLLDSDQEGSVASSEGGALTTPENFSQWFRDVSGVNVSKPVAITLVQQPGSGVFTFDDKHDPLYESLGGFFPINDELYGNYASHGKNFHFTFELDTEFVYREGTGQIFTFKGDDDVWVFIDGKCVIDIGGVHSAITQTIDLDRLDWLEDGRTYDLKFFFAERHVTQSNFRIETTLNLRSVNLPTTTALYD